MQPADEYQERHEIPPSEVSSHADVETRGSAAGASGSPPACSEPTEVFPLDYDRELAYLEHEGRLRGGRRPTGFKA